MHRLISLPHRLALPIARHARAVRARHLAVLAALALPSLALAQATAVPDRVSYQGRVLDTSGVPIANNTSTTRNAIFRIWDSASGGTRIWSESQPITIASGEFSVLLGAGAAVANETNVNTLNAIFTGQDRFLGVSIADAGGVITSEISPRQQLVTTAYAFRAKVAEAVASTAITTAMIANNAITATQLADTSVGTPKLVDSAITSAKILDGAIVAADLAANAVTTAKLAADIGVWTAAGSNVYRSAGNVGIGTTAPVSPLHTHGSGEVRMQITDTTSGTALTDGFMLSLSASDAAAWLYENRDLKFGTNNSERLRITAAGNVGIGITNPIAKLSLGADGGNTKFALWDSGSGNVMGLGIGNAQFRFHVNDTIDRFSFLSSAAGTEVMTVLGTGRVGINNSNPVGSLNITSASDSRLYLQTPSTGATGADGLTVGVHGNAGFFWMYEELPLQFATNNVQRLHIDAAGRAGYGMVSAAETTFSIRNNGEAGQHYTLNLQSSTTTNNFTFARDGTAYKFGGGTWSSGSDRRLKHNIAPLAGALDKLLQLRSVTFDYLDPEKWGAGRFTGFIAQEVEPLFPDWISENHEGMKLVGPKGFESLAVQALRELRTEKDAQNAVLAARVKELEDRNAALTAQNSATTARLDDLEKRLASLARLTAATGNNN